jgi:hypothetical protein
MAIHKRIQATISGATDVGIAQDNIIFAMLLFGFVVWITTKGELATYLAFFKPGSAGIPTNPVTASSTSGATGTTATPGKSGSRDGCRGWRNSRLSRHQLKQPVCWPTRCRSGFSVDTSRQLSGECYPDSAGTSEPRALL